MKTHILFAIFFLLGFLSWCSIQNNSLVSITPLSGYMYSGNTNYNTKEFNESRDSNFSWWQEIRYHISHKKSGLSYDYVDIHYPDDTNNLKLSETKTIAWYQFIKAWGHRYIWVIETKDTIETSSDLIQTMYRTLKIKANDCRLIENPGLKPRDTIFTGNDYIIVSYHESVIPIQENAIWKCPFTWELLRYPVFIYSKTIPGRIMVIIDQDGYSGFSYRKGMETLQW